MNDGIWIHICGGNGSGKTTMLQDIRRECPHGDTYRYVFADSGGAEVDEAGNIIRGSGKIHDKYKQPKEIQWQAIMDDWNSSVPVVISDGTRVHYAIRNAHQHGTRKRKMVVVILYQTPGTMKMHLVARCEKKGKTFRSDFWNEKNLIDIGRVHWERFYDNYTLPLTRCEYEVDTDYIIIPKVRTAVRALMAEGKWLAFEATRPGVCNANST